MDTELRQSQLITPFGVGALHISSEGISLITGGLDFWTLSDYTGENFIEAEFKIEEPRLQRILNVDYFFCPPDYRRKDRFAPHQVNKEIKIPLFRFPRTYFCQRCGLIKIMKPTERTFPTCECGSKKVVPVPLIAVCDHGHAQDFPWHEWVHKNPAPTCNKNKLYFKDTGRPGLGGLMVECKECSAFRSLSNVTSVTDHEHSFLSDTLSESGDRYLCRGEKPWLHYAKDPSCSRPLRASLRSASNLYFPVIRSAIHIPYPGIPKKLQMLFNHNTELTAVLDVVPDIELGKLRGKFHELNEFQDDEIAKAIENYTEEKQKSKEHMQGKKLSEIQQELRHEEYDVLSDDCNADDLKVRKIDLKKYSNIITDYFSTVCLIERLRETRALAGFTRVFPDTEMGAEELQRLMRDGPPQRGRRWLPANIIYGEGIFLLLDEKKLRRWESQPAVIARAENLSRNYAKAQEARKLPPKELSPRFLLIHSLSHLLINQMTYEAGYSSASLRERLYVSLDNNREMRGLLIYTAAGDSDGTMGGLVNLGEPGQLEKTLAQALENASWCSTDPVCMEMGDHGGQGPDNCNLAACHNCVLVPETACEEFNRFLDRGLVVGNEQSRALGFFADAIISKKL
jgi:hypothetical protein